MNHKTGDLVSSGCQPECCDHVPSSEHADLLQEPYYQEAASHVKPLPKAHTLPRKTFYNMFLEPLLLLVAAYTTTSAQTLNATNESYVLPMDDPAPGARQQQLTRNQQGYVYGPRILGNGPFFINGTLGNALVAEEAGLVLQEQEIVVGIVTLETDEAITEVVDVLTKVC